MDILDFKNCSYNNSNIVGGKCSSLGELYKLSNKLNFNISDGFCLTTVLYDKFVKQNNLDKIINTKINNIDITNIQELNNISNQIIQYFINSNFNDEQYNLIKQKYNVLSNMFNTDNIQVAIRSSSIAEDLPEASFAGLQDTYLNISNINDIIYYIKKCYASLFNARAISYRKTHNIKMEQVKISVAIQKMVRSDLKSAGVAFSIDPETGYNKAIVINSSYGLGELVVSGGVVPDEFICDKRILIYSDSDPIISKKMGNKLSKIIYNNNENGTIEVKTNNTELNTYSLNNYYIKKLAKIVLLLESEYSILFNKKIGVDIEWAIDGDDNQLYILQTRPETVHSNNSNNTMKKYILDQKSNILLKGIAVGDKISSGKVKILNNINEHYLFNDGDILVTDITTPDWELIMKKSSGIITNKGGRTCHAAIVAREMGLNAVVGTGNCTDILNNINEVTIFCADGEEGIIYENKLKFHIDEFQITNKDLPVKLMMNVGNPESSFTNSILPNSGVGLTRLEFIISNYIKIHPNSLINYPNLPNDINNEIKLKLENFNNGKEYFINKLSMGISKIASAFYPNDVIVRFSDFKSNEYKNLLGGNIYEPNEENPMIGWRGASRYYSNEYIEAFKLECLSIKYVREIMKLDNVIVMIPFCRTVDECKNVLKIMNECGLYREDGLKVYLMCELPSNVIEANEFSPYIDGVSIGGNDLLQLTIGVDRDSHMITHLTDNNNISYRRLISMAIKQYKENNIKVGFCGQQPSDSIEFCNFLINEGIDSISVTPDCILKTINNLN